MSVGGLLHVGCGSNPLPEWARAFKETRLDIDPACEPDIVADMVALGDIGSYDVVLCVHALEHLAPHDVPVALAEFRRVLNPGGKVVVFVPDLEGVQPTDEVLMQTPAGPVAGLDLFYGFRPCLAERPYMAHRTGFVQETLRRALEAAGFSGVIVTRLSNFDMIGGGIN